MEAVYVVLFLIFAVVAAWLEYIENGCFGLLGGAVSKAASQRHQEYWRFRFNYVAVFSMMMAGDWLQGPYVYHLYEYYGYSVRDIGRLFIMGFGSSAVFGTMAGALADRKGRKRAALLYVASYSLSCLTKHSPNYWVLLVGRLLGGISTSLLFSAFESWAVAAHNHRGFPEPLLADLFTKAVFLGNGVMAIASGLMGNMLVEGLHLGPVAPFDAAIVVLVSGGAVIFWTWEENYGDREASGALQQQFASAVKAIVQDPRVSLLGASQALFEASMYTFVFLWTPALSPNGEKLPHGFIFAIFMTASMVGTALAGRLLHTCQLEKMMQGVFWIAAVSLCVPAMFHTQHSPAAMEALLAYADDYDLLPAHLTATQRTGSVQNHSPPLLAGLQLNSSNTTAAPTPIEPVADSAQSEPQLSLAGGIQLVAFCVFEVMIGMFWPSMMTLRAKYVPEQQRSTIINVFRIPLNVFVCIILWKVSDFPLGVIFALCALFLAAAAACQYKLGSITGSISNFRKDEKSSTGRALNHSELVHPQHPQQEECVRLKVKHPGKECI